MRAHKKTLISLLLLFVITAFIGCSSNKMMDGESKIVSNESTPDWVEIPEKASTKTGKAFIGISRQHSMEQDARSDARRDAYRQAVEGLGVYVKSKIDEVVSSIDKGNNILAPAVVRDEMSRIKSSGITTGEIKEYFIRKYQKVDSGKASYYYIAYCQYIVPKDYAKNVMEGILKNQKLKLKMEKDKQVIDRALKKIEEMSTEDF